MTPCCSTSTGPRARCGYRAQLVGGHQGGRASAPRWVDFGPAGGAASDSGPRCVRYRDATLPSTIEALLRAPAAGVPSSAGPCRRTRGEPPEEVEQRLTSGFSLHRATGPAPRFGARQGKRYGMPSVARANEASIIRRRGGRAGRLLPRLISDRVSHREAARGGRWAVGLSSSAPMRGPTCARSGAAHDAGANAGCATAPGGTTGTGAGRTGCGAEAAHRSKSTLARAAYA
jgi:hypothetical protein